MVQTPVQSPLQTRRNPVSKPLPTKVNIVEPHSAYGEVSVHNLSPIVQIEFPYSINPRLVTSLAAGSGGATVSSSIASVSSGTTTASDNLLRTVRMAHFHAGQGVRYRTAAIFQSAGTSGTEAIVGLGNEEDFLGFGYNNTAFSILHRKAGKVEHRTITFTTGAVTAGGTVTITLDDVATETEVTNGGSVQAVAREVGATSYVGWETLVVGADVIFTAHLAETKSGTFSFADTDTTGVAATGGLVQSITGVAPTNTWTAQADWNEDPMNGNGPSGMDLVHSNGNTYELTMKAGFGDILFAIEDPETGAFVHVHRMKHANSQTDVVLQNPTLPGYVAVKNKATTTDIIVKIASMAIFIEGNSSEEGLNNAMIGTATGDLTTETAVLAILNKPIYQSTENRVEFQPQRVTFSANGAGAAKFTTLKVHLNPVLGGDPVFTDVSTATSPMAFDTAGTTLSGGNVTATFEFGADVESFTLNLQEDVGPLPPETLVVFAVTIDGGTSDVDIALTGRDLF